MRHEPDPPVHLHVISQIAHKIIHCFLFQFNINYTRTRGKFVTFVRKFVTFLTENINREFVIYIKII